MLDRACLSHEHAELDALAGELLACVTRDEPDLDAVARVRWAMSRRLAEHLAKEDRLLYPRVQASADAHAARIADRFAREMGGLAAAYRDYIAGWSADRIRSEWLAFRAHSRTVIEALRHRIGREERELYPLVAALEIGPMPLRASSAG